jgi:hypothetical protein
MKIIVKIFAYSFKEEYIIFVKNAKAAVLLPF